MRISSLRYFYEVAQLKSISKVSKDLHISQPALSHKLFTLEKELGVTLFERSNRGVELTTKGEILYRYSKEILNTYDNLIEEISSESYSKKEIKINVSSVYANFFVTSMAKELSEIFKGFDISINRYLQSSEKVRLLHNKADIVIGCSKINDDDLISDYIGRNKLLLVSNQFVECDKINKKSIALLDDSMSASYLKSKGLDKINASFKTDSLDMIKEYLKNPNTAAIVPKVAVEEELKLGKLTILCSEKQDRYYNLFITYRKDIGDNLKKKIKIFKQELENRLDKDDINLLI